jgi:hypothetical protein
MDDDVDSIASVFECYMIKFLPEEEFLVVLNGYVNGRFFFELLLQVNGTCSVPLYCCAACVIFMNCTL